MPWTKPRLVWVDKFILTKKKVDLLLVVILLLIVDKTLKNTIRLDKNGKIAIVRYSEKDVRLAFWTIE